jgi:hypothetical protein
MGQEARPILCRRPPWWLLGPRQHTTDSGTTRH